MKIRRLQEDGASRAKTRNLKKLFFDEDNQGVLTPKEYVIQHHINGDHRTNKKSNLFYIAGLDKQNRVLAHRYIHAKHLVDNFVMPQDVYYLDTETQTVKPLNQEILDKLSYELKTFDMDVN